MSKPSVVIYGPSGGGKTRNAKALAKHFDVSNIIDGWTPEKCKIPATGALVLCERPPPKVSGGVSVYPLGHALTMVKRGW